MTRSRHIAAHLDRIAGEFLTAVRAHSGELPVVPADGDWPSECIQTRKNRDFDYWRPVKRGSRPDFSGLENALKQRFPEELTAFFGHFWSASLPVLWEERSFELLQLWNREDEHNLMHNILGHALEKQRAREELTLFFAVVDDTHFLSCDVQTGAVMLEEVGGARPQTVADNISTLLGMVTGYAGVTPQD